MQLNDLKGMISCPAGLGCIHINCNGVSYFTIRSFSSGKNLKDQTTNLHLNLQVPDTFCFVAFTPKDHARLRR